MGDDLLDFYSVVVCGRPARCAGHRRNAVWHALRGGGTRVSGRGAPKLHLLIAPVSGVTQSGTLCVRGGTRVSGRGAPRLHLLVVPVSGATPSGTLCVGVAHR